MHSKAPMKKLIFKIRKSSFFKKLIFHDTLLDLIWATPVDQKSTNVAFSESTEKIV